jgi:hypothetical protein
MNSCKYHVKKKSVHKCTRCCYQSYFFSHFESVFPCKSSINPISLTVMQLQQWVKCFHKKWAIWTGASTLTNQKATKTARTRTHIWNGPDLKQISNHSYFPFFTQSSYKFWVERKFGNIDTILLFTNDIDPAWSIMIIYFNML